MFKMSREKIDMGSPSFGGKLMNTQGDRKGLPYMSVIHERVGETRTAFGE